MAVARQPCRLLATDLDGTLIGNEDSLIELNTVLTRRRSSLLLAYLTGRFRGASLELIEKEGLIPPDFLVCSLGTEIYRAPGYELDEKWRERMEPNWDREVVEQVLEDVPLLEPQEYQWQFKQSYYLYKEPHEVIKEVRRRLTEAGLSFKTVYSSSKFLDVIPAGGGKGGALKHIQGQLNLGDAEILVCGDSGNDMDMLTLGYYGVVVGNAKPELKSASLPDRVYFARGEFAAGILEGMEHFRF